VLVHRYLAAYVMGLANRLSSGASAHYRKHWNIGMSEWRAMMAIGESSHRIAREVAEMADLDNAAVSKSLKALQERGFVELELTGRRGGATLVKLTPAGLAVYEELRASAERRQQRLVAAFTPEEASTLWTLLRKLHLQVPVMNTDDPPPKRKAAAPEKAARRTPAAAADPGAAPAPRRAKR
jgi:DNA-binding MarR family transcriptional regulator